MKALPDGAVVYLESRTMCGTTRPASNDVCEVAMKLDEFDWMDTILPDLEGEGNE